MTRMEINIFMKRQNIIPNERKTNVLPFPCSMPVQNPIYVNITQKGQGL
jgi:hypothetical protein